MASVSIPPAQVGGHLHWTHPILCEEIRPRLSYFHSHGWLPSNFKLRTLLGIVVVERYWRESGFTLDEMWLENNTEIDIVFN